MKQRAAEWVPQNCIHSSRGCADAGLCRVFSKRRCHPALVRDPPKGSGSILSALAWCFCRFRAVWRRLSSRSRHASMSWPVARSRHDGPAESVWRGPGSATARGMRSGAAVDLKWIQFRSHELILGRPAEGEPREPCRRAGRSRRRAPWLAQAIAREIREPVAEWPASRDQAETPIYLKSRYDFAGVPGAPLV